MRHLAWAACAALLCSAGPGPAAAASAPAALGPVRAITDTAADGNATALYVYDQASRVWGELYRDQGHGRRMLLTSVGGDLAGAACTVSGDAAYVVTEALDAEDETASDAALFRLRFSSVGGDLSRELLFELSPAFLEGSAQSAGLAPVFAVSADGRRIALPATETGEEDEPIATIRVLSADGEKLWRIPLADESLRVTDLAWSPDGSALAYTALAKPSINELQTANADGSGVYVTDVGARTHRLLHRCRADLVDWGPEADEIIVAARVSDSWGNHVLRIVSAATGRKLEEFSVVGRPVALRCSPEGEALAVQALEGESQIIWLYDAPDEWPHAACELARNEGILSLVGWLRAADETSRAE